MLCKCRMKYIWNILNITFSKKCCLVSWTILMKIRHFLFLFEFLDLNSYINESVCNMCTEHFEKPLMLNIVKASRFENQSIFSDMTFSHSYCIRGNDRILVHVHLNSSPFGANFKPNIFKIFISGWHSLLWIIVTYLWIIYTKEESSMKQVTDLVGDLCETGLNSTFYKNKHWQNLYHLQNMKHLV